MPNRIKNGRNFESNYEMNFESKSHNNEQHGENSEYTVCFNSFC